MLDIPLDNGHHGTHRHGVEDDDREKYDEHEHVGVVKPREVVQYSFADPGFLRVHKVVSGAMRATVVDNKRSPT